MASLGYQCQGEAAQPLELRAMLQGTRIHRAEEVAEETAEVPKVTLAQDGDTVLDAGVKVRLLIQIHDVAYGIHIYISISRSMLFYRMNRWMIYMRPSKWPFSFGIRGLEAGSEGCGGQRGLGLLCGWRRDEWRSPCPGGVLLHHQHSLGLSAEGSVGASLKRRLKRTFEDQLQAPEERDRGGGHAYHEEVGMRWNSFINDQYIYTYIKHIINLFEDDLNRPDSDLAPGLPRPCTRGWLHLKPQRAGMPRC